MLGDPSDATNPESDAGVSRTGFVLGDFLQTGCHAVIGNARRRGGSTPLRKPAYKVRTMLAFRLLLNQLLRKPQPCILHEKPIHERRADFVCLLFNQ
jgi:hypothetical protein